jgi:mRNA interferase MazF
MKGDIVLVPFPFSDKKGKKVRPACVLADDGRDSTLAFISSVIDNQGPFDLQLKPNSANNLKKESVLKVSKLATLSRKIIIGKIGAVSKKDILSIDNILIRYFRILAKQP